MSFHEIKELNVQFQILNSFQDFYDYLKSLSNNNKLNIKKSNDKISIIFNIEVLLKQQSIEIDLSPEKRDLESNITELFEELKNTNEKIDNLLIKNKEKDNKISVLTNEIKKLKNEINILKNDKNELKKKLKIMESSIMKLMI